jgi:hypothetical protein
MAKKDKQSISDIIKEVQQDVRASTIDAGKPRIPDIITFVESPEYLGLSQMGINPYPVQRLILKVFYRGSIGNENLTLTDEEIELCEKLGLTNDDKGNVLDKYLSNEVFRELVLVWGRRSGKDFLSSIIAVYEAMKLLETPGGDPYKVYKISRSNPITILTVATASRQAIIAFNEMKSKVINSEYFKNKIDANGWGVNSICLLTPQDKERNQELRKKGLPAAKGSIVLESGHSNSDALLGKQIFVLILDEVASYKQTGGSSSGERILVALTPSLNTFSRKVQNTDEYGAVREDTIFDSKLICISSPRGQDGMFYRLYLESPSQKDRLMCRLPSWDVDNSKSQEVLRSSFHGNDEEFWMEVGAEFSGTAGENMFKPEMVKRCFRSTLKNRTYGEPGKYYFAHLDPATSSHNYALVLVHKEYTVDQETHKTDFHIVVDQIKYWHPLPDQSVSIEAVDDYVISLKRNFRLSLITYDQFNSHASLEKMRKHGIPAKLMRFTRSQENTIYSELELLISAGKLHIPLDDLLMHEMLNLQRKYVNQGFMVYPRHDGDVRSDDLVDALAGACYNALHNGIIRLPGSRVVEMSSTPSGNDITWMSMQGVPYGHGSGQAVARNMERRRPGNPGVTISPFVPPFAK